MKDNFDDLVIWQSLQVGAGFKSRFCRILMIFSERPLLTPGALDDQIDHDDDVMTLIIIVMLLMMMSIIIHIKIVCGLTLFRAGPSAVSKVRGGAHLVNCPTR